MRKRREGWVVLLLLILAIGMGYTFTRPEREGDNVYAATSFAPLVGLQISDVYVDMPAGMTDPLTIKVNWGAAPC